MPTSHHSVTCLLPTGALFSRTLKECAAHSGEHRQAAGVVAEAVIRSMELIVQPDAENIVGEIGVSGDLSFAGGK
jgi:hypothetical protein